jgi:hypothetical protein
MTPKTTKSDSKQTNRAQIERTISACGPYGERLSISDAPRDSASGTIYSPSDVGSGISSKVEDLFGGADRLGPNQAGVAQAENLNAGLEYILQPHLSLEGIFGYHHFPGSLLGDLNVYQFSVNGKTYLTGGTVRPFVNGGVGGYKFSPGSTYFGGNFGGGVLFNLTSRLGLQGSYNFHVVDTSGTATKWSDVQVGLRVEFRKSNSSPVTSAKLA